MKILEMYEIISAITYKPNWYINLYDGERPFIQLTVTNSIDSVTEKPCEWKSGKRFLSEFMCRQEIVGAVFGLIESAEIHELREWFRYKGASIYNPHLDPDALVSVARIANNFNCRENAMSMKDE